MYTVKKTEPLSVYDLKLVFQNREIPHIDSTRRDYEFVVEVEATIVGRRHQNGQDIELGHIHANILQLGRLRNNSGDLWSECEGYSQGLYDMYRTLWDKDGGLKFELEDMWMDLAQSPDICWIEEVEFKPEFRGYGLGLLAADALIKSLTSMEADIVMMNPCAINRGPQDWTPEFQLAHKLAQQKLVAYWSLMGFENWKSGGYPVLGLCTMYRRPDIRTVVPHLLDRATPPEYLEPEPQVQEVEEEDSSEEYERCEECLERFFAKQAALAEKDRI